MTPTEREALEHARFIVAGLSAQVATGQRPLDDHDLRFWRERLTQLTNSNERPDDAA